MSIDLGSMLGELSERRRSRGDMNVATMTLVVFFDQRAVGGWTRDRMHALAAKHPSRVIILDATQPDSLHDVSSQCDVHADCLKTRGDWIELGVKETKPEALRSWITALSLPEAPVVLLWGASGIGNDERFTTLSPHMWMVVYNSSVLDPGDAPLRELVRFVSTNRDTGIADLAYLRLAPWQDSIALFFDAKDVIRELFDLRRVEITCGSEAEAYYLLGWLASRLEWTPCDSTAFCNRFGVQIDFAIHLEGRERRIRRIVLSSSQTQFLAETDGDDGDAILLRVSGARQHPDRCRPINDIDVATLVERAILTGHRDRVFEESLLAAGEILSRRTARLS